MGWAELTHSDVLYHVHHPSQCCAVCGGSAAAPVDEAAGQQGLYGAPVEVSQDLGPQANLFRDLTGNINAVDPF